MQLKERRGYGYGHWYAQGNDGNRLGNTAYFKAADAFTLRGIIGVFGYWFSDPNLARTGFST